MERRHVRSEVKSVLRSTSKLLRRCKAVQVEGKKDKKSKIFHDSEGRTTTLKARNKRWTTEDDKILKEFKDILSWRQITFFFPGRTDDSVRNRYNRMFGTKCTTLTCKIPCSMWTKEEDEILIEFVSRTGNKWNEIASKLPNRTIHSIRNRYARLTMMHRNMQN